MFSLILFGILQSASTAISPPQLTAPSDSITIFGTCWDISTGVDLVASTTAVIGGKKVYIGQSNQEGKFDLRIPASTQTLIFEMDGYRPVIRPVNILGKTNKGDRFPIGIRMISLDSQQVVKPFRQIGEQAGQSTTRKVEKNRRTFFEIKDAYDNKSVKAKVCLVYSGTGRIHCSQTDTSGLPQPLDLVKGERISLHVTADGFEDYKGDLRTTNINSGDLLTHIKLLRVQNPVSMYLGGPDSLDLRFIFLDNKNSIFVNRSNAVMELAIEKGKSQRAFLLDVVNRHVNFLGKYHVVVLTGKQKFIHSGERRKSAIIDQAKAEGNTMLLEDSTTAITGLNFWAIHAESPSPEMLPNALKPSNYTALPFEKRTLYFNQSSYLLDNNTKLTLDSISEFLLKQRNAKAKLTGHTDNIGRRDLNVALSEYRARVAAHYLQQKGVPTQQILVNWKGPDDSVAVNDTEANKVKNRRVDVRVIEN